MFSAGLMKEIRSRFEWTDKCPYAGPRVLLDSAAGSFRLKSMVEVVRREISLSASVTTPVSASSRHVMEAVERGERDLRTFMGAKSGIFMSAAAATPILFQTIKEAVAHFPGTNIVTTDLDHPSVYDATRYAAAQYGKEWRVAPVSAASGRVEAENILNLIDKNTSVLAFIHGSNATGVFLDAPRIAREARNINPNICVIIDGVQYVPHAPLDIDRIGPDVYVFGPYKCYCRKGISWGYLSDRFSRTPHDKLSGHAATAWTLGGSDHTNYAAWSATVDYLCWLGSNFTVSSDRREQVVAAMTAVQSHMKALLGRLLDGTGDVKGLRNLGNVAVYGAGGDTSNRTCLILFNIKNRTASESVDQYYAKGFELRAREMDAYSRHQLQALGLDVGAIRLSAAHYTSPEEIDGFLRATAEM